MIKAFKNNEDIHKSTASKVFNVNINEVSIITIEKIKLE